MTNCTYFVEGLCEKQLIDSLKNTDLLIPGKVKVFNVVQEDLKPSHLLSIRDGYIVFVFALGIDDMPIEPAEVWNITKEHFLLDANI